MIEIIFLTLISFFTRKKPVENEELPDGFMIEKDAPTYDLKPYNIGLFHPVGKNLLVRNITGNELIKQIEIYLSLGQKSLNDYYDHQETIPEDFKLKTALFMGTIYKNKYGRLFVPCLSYHEIRGVWVKDFFCLSDLVSLRHNCIPVFLGKTSN